MCRWIATLFVGLLGAYENITHIGSFLAGPPVAVPLGHFLFYNTLLFEEHSGLYSSQWEGYDRLDAYYSVENRFESFVGLSAFCDCHFAFKALFNYKGRYAYGNVGDLLFGLDFQLLEENRWFPGLKFSVNEVFPLGNYEYFNIKRGYMEKTGSGAFSTQFALFLSKNYALYPNWTLSSIGKLQYQVSSPITAEGFHSYGGGFGSKGKLLIGNAFEALVSLGLLYQNRILFFLDTLYEHQDSFSFYGYPGFNLYGRRPDPDLPSSERISLAPSITYQFPSQFGLKLGSWFSLYGRNSERFMQFGLQLFYAY